MERPVVIRQGEEINAYMRNANAARANNLLETPEAYTHMVNAAASKKRKDRKSRKNRRDRKTRKQRKNRKNRKTRKN